MFVIKIDLLSNFSLLSREGQTICCLFLTLAKSSAVRNFRFQQKDYCRHFIKITAAFISFFFLLFWIYRGFQRNEWKWHEHKFYFSSSTCTFILIKLFFLMCFGFFSLCQVFREEFFTQFCRSKLVLRGCEREFFPPPVAIFLSSMQRPSAKLISFCHGNTQFVTFSLSQSFTHLNAQRYHATNKRPNKSLMGQNSRDIFL